MNPNNLDEAAMLRKLEPVLGELETRRKDVEKRLWRAVFVAVPFAVAAWVGLNMVMTQSGSYVQQRNDVKPTLAALAGLLIIASPFAAWAFAWHRHVPPYREEYKRRVIEPIIKAIDPSLTYHPGRGIVRQAVVDSGLLSHTHFAYSSDDLVEGRVGERAFRFAEVQVRGNKNRPILVGLYAIIEVPDTGLRLALRPNRDLFKGSDPFESAFKVVGTDERGLLTPAFRQSLAEFRASTGHEVGLA